MEHKEEDIWKNVGNQAASVPFTFTVRTKNTMEVCLVTNILQIGPIFCVPAEVGRRQSLERLRKKFGNEGEKKSHIWVD